MLKGAPHHRPCAPIAPASGQAGRSERAGEVRVDTASELDAFRAALDRQAIVAITDRRGVVTHVNDLFCKISGYAREELVGRTHRIVSSGTHPKGFFVQMWRTTAAGKIWHGEICNRAKDGRLYWVDTTIVPRRGSGGAIDGYLSVRYDITERKLAEASLAEEARRRAEADKLVRAVLEAIPDGVAAFDSAERLVLSNAAFRKLYGFGDVAGSEPGTLRDILERRIASGRFPEAGRTAQEAETWLEARMREHRRPGRRQMRRLSDGRWLQVRARRAPSGHTVCVNSDVTTIKQAELTLREKAERDPLTGVLNRAAFVERLARLLATRGKEGALALIDLNGFKAVNDTHGHDVGDALLVTLARRLREAARRGDAVARLGGDEFAVLLPGLGVPAAVEPLIERLLGRLALPVDLPGRTLFPRMSFGCAFYPVHGTTPGEIMKAADLALYEAKASAVHDPAGAVPPEPDERSGGLERVRFFAPALREAETRRRATAIGLNEALVRDEILVHLQPQVSLRGGEHVGFEALARWSRGGCLVPPGEFIPIAEAANLIGRIGAVVLDKALALARRAADGGLRPGRIAVNVAAAQLKDDRFTHGVAAALARHRIAAEDLEVEITETVLLDRSQEQISRTLASLRDLGVRIALDDFGTGYASLTHLKRYPVDRLKIDRSFVAGIEAGGASSALVMGIVDLAHGLDLEIVAEGIETREQLSVLHGFGCDIGQGFLLFPPLPPDEVGAYLEESSRSRASRALHAACLPPGTAGLERRLDAVSRENREPAQGLGPATRIESGDALDLSGEDTIAIESS